MNTLGQSPWFWLIVVALIALFFIVRSASHVREIGRLRSKLMQSQEKIQNELIELVEGENG